MLNDETMLGNENKGDSGGPAVNGIRLDAELSTRRGVYADNVMARTIGGNTVLDFLTVDVPGDSPENMAAILSARIYMPNEAVLALLGMLREHTSSWTVRDAGTNV